MAGRPPNPISLRGGVYVWCRGADRLRQARRDELPPLGARALREYKLGLEVDGTTVRLLGVLMGTSAGKEIAPAMLELPELGWPSFRTYAVVAEARLPGLPCEVGLISENTRERQWIATFGDDDLELWRYRLNLPIFLRRITATCIFSDRENYGRLRRIVWDGRRQAEAWWRTR